jgi:hypothetical protein
MQSSHNLESVVGCLLGEVLSATSLVRMLVNLVGRSIDGCNSMAMKWATLLQR